MKKNFTKQTKRWICVVAVLLAVILALGITLGVATKWGKDLDNLKPAKNNAAQTAGGMELGESDSAGKLSLTSTVIPIANYADYGISPASEAAVTVKASFKDYAGDPLSEEDAAKVKLVWTTDWKSKDGWASGKSCSDYVTVSPQEDTHSVTVSCSQAFGAQIELKAAVEGDEDVSGSIPIDYEYKTKEILVTSNEEFYNAVHPYVGLSLAEQASGYYWDTDLSWGFGTDPHINNHFNEQTVIYNGTTWNMRVMSDPALSFQNGANTKALQTLYYLFPTKDWCDIEEYDPLSAEVEEIGGIKGNALYSYIKNYKTSFENGRLPIKDGMISADLFEDDIDETRKMDNERGKIQKGYSYYDFDADLDLQSWVGWGDEEHGFWENSSAYGFWNALFGRIPQEHGDVISPIQVLTKESEDQLKVPDSTLVNNLYINAADIAEFKQECTDAFTVSGIDDEEKYVVLFRFAVTDYKEENADLLSFGFIPARRLAQAYLAQETVFFDFDVIHLSFLKGENWKIVPAVSDPIDIVNDITPPYIPGTDKGLPMIVKVILIALVVLFAIVLISFVVKLFNGLSDLVNGNRRR